MAEIQALYDTDRRLTGETFVRGDQIPEGRFRLGVQVWLKNSDGQFLLTQRHPSKKHPLLWEPTGGSVRVGEDTLDAGIRELYEEIGVRMTKEELTLIRTEIHSGNEFLDIYLATWVGSIESLMLQPDEVVDARWCTLSEITEMAQFGLLAYDCSYLFTR